MKLQKEAGTIFDRILNLLAWLAIGIITCMEILVASEVFMRYVLNRPHAYVDELVKYSIVYITFLGAAWLLKSDGHVKLDLVVDRLSTRSGSVLNIVTSIVSAIVCLIVGWYGSLLIWNSFREGFHMNSVLAPPEWIIFLIIPIGFFLLFIQFLRRAYGYFAAGKHQ